MCCDADHTNHCIETRQCEEVVSENTGRDKADLRLSAILTELGVEVLGVSPMPTVPRFRRIALRRWSRHFRYRWLVNLDAALTHV